MGCGRLVKRDIPKHHNTLLRDATIAIVIFVLTTHR